MGEDRGRFSVLNEIILNTFPHVLLFHRIILKFDELKRRLRVGAGGQGDGSLGSPILGAKTTTYTYTALGKVESIVDSLNNRQEFNYDSMGRNTIVRDALNNTSTAEYDKLGNVTKLAGPLGGATNYSYDQMGRLISESTSSGGTIT